MEKKEIKALVSLLDDDDHSIVTQVEEKIISLGNEIIPFLEGEWENSFNPIIQRKLEELIHVLQFEHLKLRLLEWKENGYHDLLEGMWLVATYQYPDLQLDYLRKEIEQMYHEAWRDFRSNIHPYDQVKILNNVLYTKYKFSANTTNFHSPANSMINIVLETRRGNPITLCVIYLLIAQKLEMPVHGVNLPNLFVCTYKSPQLQFYINAFNKGLLFSRADLENYVSNLQITPLDIFFEPCSYLDVIKRVLRNLIISFEKIGDHYKVDEIKILLDAVSFGDDDRAGSY
ncbi:MAG: transglutaminase family protein [Cyclobacteriaceae bacterium]|nr:transglutaminase family protein [Cyclobacteriaceae bacterium]